MECKNQISLTTEPGHGLMRHHQFAVHDSHLEVREGHFAQGWGCARSAGGLPPAGVPSPTTNRSVHIFLFAAITIRNWPDGMAELVEHPLSCFGWSGIWASWFQNLVESNQWHKDWYLSLPSLTLSIIRIGQGSVEWGRPINHDWNFPCLIN